MSDEIQSELSAAREDPAFWDDSDMGHAAAVQRVANLTSQISGNDPVSQVMPEIEHNAAAGDGLDAKTEDFLTAPAHPEDISFGALNDAIKPADFQEDPAEIEQCRDWLYSAEIPQSQIDGFVRLYCDALSWDQARFEKEGQAAKESLTQKYGDATPRALHLAYSAANSIGGEEFLEYLEVTGLGNCYHVIQTLIDCAERKGHLVHAK
jgi:hypothetical protein